MFTVCHFTTELTLRFMDATSYLCVVGGHSVLGLALSWVFGHWLSLATCVRAVALECVLCRVSESA